MSQRIVNGRDDLLVVLAALPPLALFLLREQAIAGAAGFPLDDSWIHLHFARNLAGGAGFSYNPGVPVAGSTAPLWTLLLGAGAFILGASLPMAKLLGISCALAAAVVTRRASLAWGASREVALASGIALSWTGGMAWGALSGMEVPLAALLVAASHVDARTRSDGMDSRAGVPGDSRAPRGRAAHPTPSVRMAAFPRALRRVHGHPPRLRGSR